MKTPEELAEEWIETSGWNEEPFRDEYVIEFKKEGYVAGYKAAQEHAHAALEEAEAEIDRLQTKLSDAGILTTEHLLGADNSSNNSNGWISVKDRLPEDFSEVLIAFGGGVSIACYDGDWREPVYPMLPLLSVTHWMPLPAEPKEEA